MKTQQRPQRHTLLFLVLMILTTSCVGIFKKKEEDPEPQLAGTYTISSYEVTIGTGRETGSSGTVTVTGPTNNQIGLTLKLPGYNPLSDDGVEVRKNGSNYDMYDGSTKLGSLNGTDFNYDEQGSNAAGQFIHVKVIAKK